jgi:hypothetical protein
MICEKHKIEMICVRRGKIRNVDFNICPDCLAEDRDKYSEMALTTGNRDILVIVVAPGITLYPTDPGYSKLLEKIPH